MGVCAGVVMSGEGWACMGGDYTGQGRDSLPFDLADKLTNMPSRLSVRSGCHERFAPLAADFFPADVVQHVHFHDPVGDLAQSGLGAGVFRALVACLSGRLAGSLRDHPVCRAGRTAGHRLGQRLVFPPAVGPLLNLVQPLQVELLGLAQLVAQDVEIDVRVGKTSFALGAPEHFGHAVHRFVLGGVAAAVTLGQRGQ